VAPALNTLVVPEIKAPPNSSSAPPLLIVKLPAVPPEATARVMPPLTTKPLVM
jgi:hypothetical protein